MKDANGLENSMKSLSARDSVKKKSKPADCPERPEANRPLLPLLLPNPNAQHPVSTWLLAREPVPAGESVLLPRRLPVVVHLLLLLPPLLLLLPPRPRKNCRLLARLVDTSPLICVLELVLLLLLLLLLLRRLDLRRLRRRRASLPRKSGRRGGGSSSFFPLFFLPCLLTFSKSPTFLT